MYKKTRLETLAFTRVQSCIRDHAFITVHAHNRVYKHKAAFKGACVYISFVLKQLRWPEQPYQVYCENTCRVALRRRLPSDDQWVVPHNLYVHLRLRPSLYKIRAFCMERPCYVQVSMFNPSTINVICFDPNHNSDQARGYAAKYCSKPEKWWANFCR